MVEPGLHVFVFSDVEDSTPLWERAPLAMRGAIANHNEIILAAVNHHGGRVFKWVGDAACCVFPDVPSAAEAVCEAHANLESYPWPPDAPIRVRWAIHAGVAEPDGDDYLGPALNQVARLLGLANPGQVLCGEEVARTLPNRTARLGQRLLKGISQPFTVYQLNDPRLPERHLPLGGLAVGDSNLPHTWNEFVGRTEELAALTAMVKTNRITTVAGPGGSGKTRLAIEAATRKRGDFGGGVWFADLAPTVDNGSVAETLAHSLGLPKAGQADSEELIEWIGTRHLLWIIDNCEHVVPAVAETVIAILRRCPHLHVLFTSRMPLQIAGEMRLNLAGLDPDHEGLRLFEVRASAVTGRPTFASTERDAAAQLCRRLDGIPLLIELAAAQLDTYSISEIDKLLTERRLQLASSDPSLSPHRQNTDAMIDWSYGRLAPAEQRLLRSLAVFSGGCDLRAIQTIAGDEGARHVAKLVHASLLQFHSDENRYRMLELVREFMMDRLVEHGELEDAKSRHLAWLADLAEEARPQLDGPQQGAWLDRLETEHANVRAGLTWSGDRRQRARIAVALHWFWYLRGHMREGQAWLVGSLAGGPLGDPKLEAEARSAAGVLAWMRGELAEASEQLEVAVTLAQELDEPAIRAKAQANLAMVRAQGGDLDGAESAMLDARCVFRANGDAPREAHMLNNLGVLRSMRGDPEGALDYLRQCVEVHRQRGDRVNVALTECNMAQFQRELGDFGEAADTARRAVLVLLEHQEFGAIGTCLVELAVLKGESDHPEAVARLSGKAAALLTHTETQIPEETQRAWETMMKRAELTLTQQLFSLYYQQGSEQTIASLVEV